MRKILSFVLAITVLVSGVAAITTAYSKGLSPPFAKRKIKYGKN